MEHSFCVCLNIRGSLLQNPFVDTTLYTCNEVPVISFQPLITFDNTIITHMLVFPNHLQSIKTYTIEGPYSQWLILFAICLISLFSIKLNYTHGSVRVEALTRRQTTFNKERIFYFHHILFRPRSYAVH